MHIKESFGRKVFNVINVCIILIIVAFTLYPMLYVFFASFSESSLLMEHQGLLLKPVGFSIAAYKSVFKNPNILIGYRNTLFILVAGTSINMILTLLAGYVLSRKGLLFRNVIMLMIVFTMFFSGGMIPTYLIVKNLGLTDTFWALFLPTAISTYNMIIMRTGFASIPDSLEESAKLDGARHITILTRIAIPLAKPTIAVIVLYYAVEQWNSWFPALIYLPHRRELRPLQLVLRSILIENDTNSMLGNASNMGDHESISETIKHAVIIVATLPILFVYPVVQKYFIKGIMIGAVKG